MGPEVKIWLVFYVSDGITSTVPFGTKEEATRYIHIQIKNHLYDMPKDFSLQEKLTSELFVKVRESWNDINILVDAWNELAHKEAIDAKFKCEVCSVDLENKVVANGLSFEEVMEMTIEDRNFLFEE